MDTVLKILSGVQAGVEVSLAAGEYVLGSGPDDDIQIIDVTLKPGHARLRLAPGAIEIAAGSGAVRTTNGTALDAGSEWQALEPLEVVTAGTTRFALGPPTANWASIAELDAPSPQATQAKRPPGKSRTPVSNVVTQRRGMRLAVPLLALGLLVGVAGWHLSSARVDSLPLPRLMGQSSVQAVRSAVGQLPFQHAVTVRQEVDGAIFVAGYVESQVERRAVVAAVEATGIPARTRVWVLQTLRQEFESLAASQELPVTATVSPDGVLTIEGVVLNEAKANRFVELVGDRIFGVARVESRIRTAKTFLAEVERLAQVSQIQPHVLLRTERELIEVTGAIPIEKIDAWTGFLQAYARRFARDIGLRSFVQLQNVSVVAGAPTPAAGAPSPGTPAIVVGGPAVGTGDVVLDLDLLKQGSYSAKDVLVGAGQPGRPESPTVGWTRPQGAGGTRSILSLPAASATPAVQRASSTGGASPQPAAAVIEGGVPEPAAPAAGTGDRELVDRTRTVLEAWERGQLDSDEQVRAAIDRLQQADPGAGDRRRLVDRYLLVSARRNGGGPDACWPASQLTPQNLAAVTFWLDLLSISDGLSITSFDSHLQALILEAAVNPHRAGKCADRTPEIPGQGGNVVTRSLYFGEIARNPDFVRFITRGLQPFSLDISGANLGSGPRFVQTRAGRKLFEGAAPDAASRVTSIGDIGVTIQVREGLAAVVYGPDINWLVAAN